MEDTEGDGVGDTLMGAEAERPTERDTEGDGEADTQWVLVVHTVGVAGTVMVGEPLLVALMEAVGEVHAEGLTVTVPECEGEPLREPVTLPVAVMQLEAEPEPLYEGEGVIEGEGEADCVARLGSTVPVTEPVAEDDGVNSFALTLGEGDREGEPDTDGEGVIDTVARAEADPVEHTDCE